MTKDHGFPQPAPSFYDIPLLTPWSSSNPRCLGCNIKAYFAVPKGEIYDHEPEACRVILTFAPIKQRPDGWHTYGGKWAPFTASYRSTLVLLDRELTHLRAKEPILQVEAAPGQIRMDGQLRADARVNADGVILSFEIPKHGTLTYPCCAFTGSYKYPGWQANLRAIALGLEALRKVERYGIAERGQQYAGYAELGTGIALGAGMTLVEAAKILTDVLSGWDWGDVFVDEDQADPDSVREAYRRAALILHPDNGGDPEDFHKITEARDLLLRQS